MKACNQILYVFYVQQRFKMALYNIYFALKERCFPFWNVIKGDSPLTLHSSNVSKDMWSVFKTFRLYEWCHSCFTCIHVPSLPIYSYHFIHLKCYIVCVNLITKHPFYENKYFILCLFHNLSLNFCFKQYIIKLAIHLAQDNTAALGGSPCVCDTLTPTYLKALICAQNKTSYFVVNTLICY